MASMALSQECIKEKSILIIGAGISGLSAAYHLKSLGFTNVQILEARSRIGGRIHSIDYDSGLVEMGAQWIHGQEKNVMYSLAKENSLVDEFEDTYAKELFSWSHVTCENERKVILQTVEFLEGKMAELQGNIYVREKSLFRYLQENFESYLTLKNLDSQMRSVANSVFQWYLSYQCELNGCDSLTSVSAGLLHCYHECAGLSLTELKKGYCSILKILLTGLPEAWILTNKYVSKIITQTMETKEDSNDKEIKLAKVICHDNSVYFAEHIIVTIPLGCLKATEMSLFSPPLPSRKKEAIEHIGFGVLNKIYLKYEEPFWEPKFVFNVLWDSNELGESRIEDQQKSSQPWYKCINRFSFVMHHPKVICAWVAGKGAVSMEELTLEQVISDCHKVLKLKLQRQDLPYPVDGFRSEWSSDMFSKGSYSYLSVDCETKSLNNMDLAQPICVPALCGQHPTLLFAGEATHSSYYSTVHGAYETGIREADRIFFHYQYSHKSEDTLMLATKSFVTNSHVVIIGAGASGLACAQKLAKAGISDIIILEGSERIGGRINTVPCGISVVELGAQWIHGEEGNPLHAYCKHHNLLVDPKVCVTNEAKGLFCTSEGEVVPECIIDEVMSKLQELKEMVNCMNHAENYKGAENYQSMQEVFCSGFQKYMDSCDDSTETKAWKIGIFNWFLKFELIDNACDSLQDITTLGYAAWVECPGYFYTSFKNGFCSFLETLVKEIPNSSIVLSKPVKCVHWKNTTCNQNSILPSHPVLIECWDGDWYCTKHVVVTASVGFIQRNLKSFFNPCLPKTKEIAFKTTGFGTANKIFLLFPCRFWTDDELGFQLVWLDHSNMFNFSLAETSWVNGILGFDQVLNQPNVLVTWIGGSYAKQVEEISDDAVGRTCTELLRKFLPNRNIPFPTKIIRSKWFSDTYTKGSYSNRTKMFYEAGCSVKDLSEPLEYSYTSKDGKIIQWPAVSFAGEAMDEKYFATVHGALCSGWQAANSIINFTRNEVSEE